MNNPSNNANWLFHYTNAVGLQGILKDKTFHATDANFLSDFKEIQLGVAYARSWLEENRDALVNIGGKHLVNSLDINMNPTPGSQSGPRMFVCSFSTNPDSLSQWRANGAGGGYAIGIYRDYLAKKAKKLGLTIEQCVYKHDSSDNPVADFLSEQLDNGFFALVSAAADDVDRRMTLLENVIAGIMRKSITLKGKAFSEEGEWRVVPSLSFGAEKNIQREFRVKNGVLVPYVKFDLFPKVESEKYFRTSPDSKCPVLKLMIGPTAHKELAGDGLRKWLWQNQDRYHFLGPSHSTATERDW